MVHTGCITVRQITYADGLTVRPNDYSAASVGAMSAAAAALRASRVSSKR